MKALDRIFSVIFLGLAASLPPMSAYAQSVTSSLSIFLSAETRELPAGPSPKRLVDNCVNWAESPTTPGGRLVQNSGWAVTGEHRLGEYALVTFAGEFIPGTSGTCKVQQSNIAVFRDGILRSIVYTARSEDSHLGQLQQMEDGILRLWSGDFLPAPVADVSIKNGSVNFANIRDSDNYCSSDVAVPTVYGADISDARRALIAAGWTPVPAESEGFGRQVDLHAMGIIEAENCSGTGLAHCSFNYENAGIDLRVVTAGELYEHNEPVVAWYTVDCW